MQRAFLFSAFAASLWWASDARAGLILTVPSTTFYTNQGTGVLDVEVTGDGSTPFGNFSLSFSITPDPSNATTPFPTLGFVSPGDPSLDPTLTNTSYVFYGNSGDQDPFFPTPFGTASGPDNTILGVLDSTDNGSDVTLGAGQTKLLAELVFSVPTNITNPGGDLFDIMLTSDPNTALQSNNTGQYASVAGTLMGVVTVEAPNVSPVPEPGTLGMLLTGMVGLLWTKRRRVSVDRKPSNS